MCHVPRILSVKFQIADLRTKIKNIAKIHFFSLKIIVFTTDFSNKADCPPTHGIFCFSFTEHACVKFTHLLSDVPKCYET